MKFHIGMPPESPDFSPQSDGWTLLKEPSFTVLAIVATVVGLLLGILDYWAWESIGDVTRRLTTVGIDNPLTLVAAFMAIVVVHEFLHAFGYPSFGFTSQSLIGVVLLKGTFYALYLGTMSRNRWLLVYVLPFLFLSVLPLMVCAALGVAVTELEFVSVVNAVCCGGDLFCVALILFQVPRDAVMRNQGWPSWWKLSRQDKEIKGED